MKRPTPKTRGRRNHVQRPQFGIRLCLLVVALLATLFAWRGAVDSKRRAEGVYRESEIEARILQLERHRAWMTSVLEELETGIACGDPRVIAADIEGLKAQIDAIDTDLRSFTTVLQSQR